MERPFGGVVACQGGEPLNLPECWSHSRDCDRDVSALVIVELVNLFKQTSHERRGLLVALDKPRGAASSHVNNNARVAIRSLHSQIVDGIRGIGLKSNADYRQPIRFRASVPEQHVGEIACGDSVTQRAAPASAGVRAHRRDVRFEFGVVPRRVV